MRKTRGYLERASGAITCSSEIKNIMDFLNEPGDCMDDNKKQATGKKLFERPGSMCASRMGMAVLEFKMPSNPISLTLALPNN